VADRWGKGPSTDEHCSCGIVVVVVVAVECRSEHDSVAAVPVAAAAADAVEEGNGGPKVEAFCGRQGRIQAVRMLLVPAAAGTEAVDGGCLVALVRNIPLRPFSLRCVDGFW
jgi:hypothetical protein